MNFLNLIEEKAKEKGIAICSKCQTPDIFFSLSGKCDNCGNPIPSKPEKEKLQFSIETLILFAENYDEFLPVEAKKVFVQLGKAIIYNLKNLNQVDNSKLISFQSLINKIPLLGGNNIGAAVNCIEISVQFSSTCKEPLTAVKSIAGVIYALQFIKEFKVKNEFVIENIVTTTPSTPDKTVTKDVQAKSNNSGCMSAVLFLVLTLIIAFIML